MKTAYYTFTAWDDGKLMAAGYDGGAGTSRRTALIRQPGPGHAPESGMVIDFTAWRAADLDLSEEEPLDGEIWPEEALEELSAPRVRRCHRALFTAELASTLSVAAAALAIILRVLTF